MRHILLPTDFSDNALNAIDYALKLFKNENCTFYFLNVVEMQIPTTLNLTNKLLDTLNENALKKLEELRKQKMLACAISNFNFETIVSSEYLVYAIIQEVIAHNIDIVVMGTKGTTGAKEFFFGRNTNAVIKKMNLCPVLVVPEKFDFEIPTQIAFPTDFKRFYSDIELKPLKDIATLYNSDIRVVHINVEDNLSSKQENNMKALKQYLKKFEYSFHWMPNFAKKAKSINIFIEELEIDMLVMVNYKHSFIENIINEHVIQKVGFHPIVPFMIIQDLD